MPNPLGAREPEVRSKESLLGLGVLALSLVLPIGLILASIETYRAVDNFRRTYFETRAIALAERVSRLGRDEVLLTEDDVIDINILELSESGAAAEDSTTEYWYDDAPDHFQAFVRLQPRKGAQGRPVVVRIDLVPATGDMVVRDAYRNLTLALLSALASLGILGAYLIILRRSEGVRHLATLGTMSAALAHEIRNPLGTIKGYAQLIRESTSTTNIEYLDALVAEVRRLEQLVHDLLSFAKPNEPAFRRVEWYQLVRRLVGSQGSAEARVEFAGPDQLAFRTDPDKAVEILLNLIRNAVEAHPTGTVRVSAAKAGSSANITVADQGPGIAEVARKKAFEPFYSTKATGTGLGLPISKRLAQQLKGALDLRSSPGNGTTARLTLPAWIGGNSDADHPENSDR